MKILFEQQNFFHPSVIPYRGKLMMVMQKQIAMDRYAVPVFTFSDNNGIDWSEPVEISTLKGCEKCADFRPLPQPDDRTAGIIGLIKRGNGYKTVYLTYDGEWSEPEELPELK